MIDVRRQEDQYQHRRSWLDTEWHFSFGEYQDPENTNFGPLRVVNNDRIDGGGGFPMHSHEDMEILTWVIEGSIVHKDSTDTREKIGRNGLQKMSAGTGISHSEINGSEEETLHLIQIWIKPSEKGIEPAYEDATFDEAELTNTFCRVASGEMEAPVSIVQDASLYAGIWDGDQSDTIKLSPDRRGYGVLIKGEASLGGQKLMTGDAVRVSEESRLDWQTHKPTECLWIDLP